MQLNPDEIKLFYATFYALLNWVNAQRKIAPGAVFDPDVPASVDPSLVMPVREALWADDALLEAFVADNPRGLSPEALALVASWRHRKAETLIVYRQLAKHVVVLDDGACKAYAVVALKHPLGDLLPFMPCMAKMVLLPFGDRIIYDSILAPYRLHMGPGIRRRLDDLYRLVKPNLVTRLSPSPTSVLVLPAEADAPAKPAKKPAKKPVDVDALVQPGQCAGCGEVFSKRTMGRHIDQCDKVAALGRGAQTTLYRLVVEPPGLKDYWLHLDVPAGTTLAKIDAVLRDTWLECCGHLSAFRIADTTFASSPMDDPWSGRGERKMTARIEDVADVPKWSYEYDYGSTTRLALRPAGTRPGRGGGVRVVARNLPPKVVCGTCGAPATQVNTVATSEDEWAFCDACAEEHDEDYFLPLVNSPRTGVCGYTG